MRIWIPLGEAPDATASAPGAAAPTDADPIKLWELRWEADSA